MQLASDSEPATNESVHLWVIELDAMPTALGELHAGLSADEQFKAAQFRSAIDHARYVVSHAALRNVLARYVRVPAAVLRFQVNSSGKPQLVTRLSEGGRLYFNLAHSNALALLAVSEMAEVGIDVEYLRPMPDYQFIAARCYSAAEQSILADAADAQRTFYRCWTAKEAVVKCLGQGLRRELNDFTVLKDEVQLVDCVEVPVGGSSENVTMLGLQPLTALPADYQGALAVTLDGVARQITVVSRSWCHP